MKISIEFRNPTPMHCDVAVFVNGAQAGTLRLRQDEVVGFQQILAAGCRPPVDEFVARGNPNTPEMMMANLEQAADAAECLCRTPSCGHGASEHRGPNGACVICQRECWM